MDDLLERARAFADARYNKERSSWSLPDTMVDFHRAELKRAIDKAEAGIETRLDNAFNDIPGQISGEFDSGLRSCARAWAQGTINAVRKNLDTSKPALSDAAIDSGALHGYDEGEGEK